ncbi:hypothetical protein B0T20DRAFT_151827 [Sordaria brevicollis]|uniref:Uncharacterized protein n=1 Tax=Sordaria brevicollis TaxID=83679 RepID=A0AAE0PIK7_SORBR|nr:hypothetical protein B0T20DRAFT_151827 [Sordaria brevicollis]
MQLIFVLTALAAFKVAAALPSSVKESNDLVAREGLMGSMLCVGYHSSGLCQFLKISTAGYCIKLDNSLAGAVSSMDPFDGGWCTFYMSEDCTDNTGCGHYDASSPISDLTTVSPTNPNTKCEGNMDKKIRSFTCNPL